MATVSRSYRQRHPRQLEEGEQQRFINYIKREFPHLPVFCDAIGEDLTDAGRLRQSKQRTRRGIPDVIIDYPSRGYHGARFEFKKTGTVIYKKDGKSLRAQPYRYVIKGRLYSGDHLAEQAATLTELNRLGYFARFAVGFDKAVELLHWYLEVPDNTELDF